jgi:hypothetical protein
MTNGANYKRGKLHHSPWHSNIRTSNQFNTPPRWLSCPFQTKTVNKREEETIKHRGSSRNKRAQRINLLSNRIPYGKSSSDTIPATIPELTQAVSEAISDSNSEADSDHSH